MKSYIGMLVAGMSFTAGCADVGSTAAAGSLETPAVIVSDRAAEVSRLEVVVDGGVGAGPVELSLPVAELGLRVRTGDRPALEQLELSLGDVKVPAAALPPTGLELRDLRLALPEPARAQVVHVQDSALELLAQAPLELSWSLMLEDGSLYPLGTVRTQPLDLALTVVRDGSGPGATATLTARCAGVCWELGGVAELRDGELYLEAPVVITPLH